MMRQTLVCLALLAACTDSQSGPGIDAESHVATIDLPLDSPDPVDVVFVIDDSPELAPFRDKLVESYPRMMGAFDPISTRPDLHVAVIGGDGKFRVSQQVLGNYIQDVVREDYSFGINYTGTLAEAFASLAHLGAADTASPQLLASLEHRLQSADAITLLRPNAALYIVIITARDDASALSISEYAAQLKALKPDPNLVALGIAHAGAAPRLDELAAQFPSRSVNISLADADPAEVMSIVPLFQKTTLGYPCFEPPADLDPETPGVQAQCSAHLTHFGSIEGSVLPGCDSSDAPCWWWKPANSNCPDFVTVGITLGDARWPRNGHLIAECVVAN